MKQVDDANRHLSPDDRRLIEAIAQGYRPEPMSVAQQAAFRRRLEERLAQRSRMPWRISLAIAATAVAAVVLWLRVPYGAPSNTSQLPAFAQAESPVLYAFVDPDDYDTDSPQAEDFLPDDYAVLASVLRVPVDDR